MHLSDFNSVLEVSIALHLAFAFVGAVHDFHIRKLEDYVDSAADVAQNPPKESDSGSLRFWVSHVRWLVDERRREVKKTVFFMQVCSVMIAIIALALLVCAGVSAEFPLGVFDLIVLLILTLLPMPTFCLLSYFSHRKWLRRIADARRSLQTEWTSVIGPILLQFLAKSER